MSFCKQCNYALDISKIIPIVNQGKIEKTDVITNVNDFIARILKKTETNNLILGFQINQINNNSKFKKLSKPNQETIIKAFHEIIQKNDNKTGVHFICKNCGYTEPLPPKTIIFSENLNSIKTTIDTNYDLIINDYTLPRTRDYICKNSKCSSHDSKNKLTKEAVFYRTDGYKTKYVCCLCKTDWIINL